MKKENFIKKLKSLNACEEAIEFAKTKSSWQEVYSECDRGDWLLWLFAKTNPDDVRLLILAKGKCAETVKHLMKDERSIAAVEAAIAYGQGKISKKELDKFTAAAHTAHAAAAAAAAFAATHAADTAYTHTAAAHAAAAHAAAAYSANAYSAAAYSATRKEKLKQAADIVRNVIKIEQFNL
jgi:hypothetical protein